MNDILSTPITIQTVLIFLIVFGFNLLVSIFFKIWSNARRNMENKCEKCGNLEFKDSDILLMSNPPKKQEVCQKCGKTRIKETK